MILPLLPFLLVPIHSVPIVAAAAPVSSARSVSPDEIQWFQGPHMSALGKARHEKRPVALYFWMNGSALCSKMYTETLQDPGVVAELQSAVCLGVDIASANGTKLVQRYGITTLPTMLFLSSEGEREEAVIGFIDGPTLTAELQRIASGTGTVTDFRIKVAASPDDLKLQHDLALKLRDVGNQKGHDDIVANIRAQDPKGKTETGARLLFWETRATALAQAAPADVKLKPVYAVARKLTPPVVLYEAWDWLATFELGRGSNKPAREAARKAWKHAGPNQLAFGVRTTMNYWGMRDELNGRDTNFLLEMSRVYLKQARETLAADAPPVPAGGGEEEESPANRLALAIDAASMAHFMDGDKTRAIQLIEEAMQIAPQNDALALRLAVYGR